MTASRQTTGYLDGLLRQTRLARRLGLLREVGRSSRQLPVLHEAFTPSQHEISWARKVVEAFEAAGGDALRTQDGEFVDLPVAQRARRLLELAGTRTT